MRGFIELDLTRAGVAAEDLKTHESALIAGHKRLLSEKEGYTGWVKLPVNYNVEEVRRIIDTAREIREKCQAFIIIGIGGSYLGARAVITALQLAGSSSGSNSKSANALSDSASENIPEIYFAGQNISGTYHAELLEQIKNKDICLCVISKSGTTTEPSIAFSLLKEELLKRYGKEEANKRIYAITDEIKGVLCHEAKKECYVSFVVPDDIGGRFSVLTPVGLLPIAVAGIDILQLLDGAKAMTEVSDSLTENPAWQYAACRQILHKKGKKIEIYETYEPRLGFFSEWLKQLFGESEGKDGKGIFPSSLQFSTDLHSMGQFLQEGSPIFFETILNLQQPPQDITVPECAGPLLAGKSMNEINQAAMQGVMAAHQSAGIPIVKIDIPELTPYCFGQLIYFFEKACALSGFLMGVNPFDQPGVEKYKNEMRKFLQIS